MPYNTYRPDLMGSATLSPQGSFAVDSFQTFKLIYTAGKFGIDDQGGLRVGFRGQDRKSTRLNSSHSQQSRMPSSA